MNNIKIAFEKQYLAADDKSELIPMTITLPFIKNKDYVEFKMTYECLEDLVCLANKQGINVTIGE